MFQPLIKYFEVSKTRNPVFISWKSKGLSDEIINPPTTKNNILNPKLDYFNIPKSGVKFEGGCLKTIAKPYTFNKIANFYFVHEIKIMAIP